MKDNRHNSGTRISLEQLLQVKRAERPDRSFWNEFDQEFRRRQLASLVSTQPWYVRWGKGSLVALRRTAPAAATVVVVALGIAVYHEQSATSDNPSRTVASNNAASEEATYIVLPEEQFVSSGEHRHQRAKQTARAGASIAKAQLRFATLELNSTVSQSRSFTTVTSPYAFAAAANDDGMYVVNDLTTGPVMRVPSPPVGNL